VHAAIGAEVRLVEVLAVVRDSRGQAVPGLTRDDFEIRDEGKSRELTAFSVQQAAARTAIVPASRPAALEPGDPAAKPSTQPAVRTIALLFDDVNSAAGDFMQVRNAALNFVKKGLAPGDRVGIFSAFSSQVLPFTSDRDQITTAVAKLNPRTRTDLSIDCPALTPYLAYLLANNLDHQLLTAKVAEMQRCDPASQAITNLSSAPRGRVGQKKPEPDYDTASGDVPWEDPIALNVVRLARMVWSEQEISSKDSLGAIESAVDHLAVQSGQRMLLLGSSGFLAGTLQSEQEALITQAVHAGVVINALDAKGLYTMDVPAKPLGSPGNKSSIYAVKMGTRPKDAANEIMENLSAGTGGKLFRNSNDLEGGFSELMEVPEVSYLLGFSPPDPDGKFHRLKIQVPGGRGYTIQARQGYMSEKKSAAPSREERKIDREVFASDESRDVPVGLELTSEPSPSGANILRAVFHVDVRTLPFVEQSGVRTEKLSFLLALLDKDGNFVSGKEGSMEFALKQGTFDRLQGTRLDASLQLEMPPAGTYRLRVLVEEANGGKMTEATRPLQAK
jgi:VWFA-related protein